MHELIHLHHIRDRLLRDLRLDASNAKTLQHRGHANRGDHVEALFCGHLFRSARHERLGDVVGASLLLGVVSGGGGAHRLSLVRRVPRVRTGSFPPFHGLLALRPGAERGGEIVVTNDAHAVDVFATLQRLLLLARDSHFALVEEKRKRALGHELKLGGHVSDVSGFPRGRLDALLRALEIEFVVVTVFLLLAEAQRVLLDERAENLQGVGGATHDESRVGGGVQRLSLVLEHLHGEHVRLRLHALRQALHRFFHRGEVERLVKAQHRDGTVAREAVLADGHHDVGVDVGAFLTTLKPKRLRERGDGDFPLVAEVLIPKSARVCLLEFIRRPRAEAV